jgi:hypothetical protein
MQERHIRCDISRKREISHRIIGIFSSSRYKEKEILPYSLWKTTEIVYKQEFTNMWTIPKDGIRP